MEFVGNSEFAHIGVRSYLPRVSESLPIIAASPPPVTRALSPHVQHIWDVRGGGGGGGVQGELT